MILHHWHWSKCLTMKTAPGPIVTGFCGWKCNVCVTVVYVYTVIIVMQNTGIDNQVQVAWCINDSRSTANRLQLGSQLQAAPSQRGHNSALHPQPSTGPSGQAVLTILHQLAMVHQYQWRDWYWWTRCGYQCCGVEPVWLKCTSLSWTGKPHVWCQFNKVGKWEFVTTVTEMAMPT